MSKEMRRFPMKFVAAILLVLVTAGLLTRIFAPKFRFSENSANVPAEEPRETITAGTDFTTCWYKGSAAASRGGESIAVAVHKDKANDFQRTCILFGTSTQRPLLAKEIDGFVFGQIATSEAASIALGCDADDTLKILDQKTGVVSAVARDVHNIDHLSISPSGKVVAFTTGGFDEMKVRLWSLGTATSGFSDGWSRANYGGFHSLLANDDETLYAAAATGVYHGRRNGATIVWNQEMQFPEKRQSAAIDVKMSVPILVAGFGNGVVQAVRPGHPASMKRVILQDRGVIQKVRLSPTGKYAAIVQWAPPQQGAFYIVDCENMTEVSMRMLSKAPPLDCWWERDSAIVLLNDGSVFVLTSR